MGQHNINLVSLGRGAVLLCPRHVEPVIIIFEVSPWSSGNSPRVPKPQEDRFRWQPLHAIDLPPFSSGRDELRLRQGLSRTICIASVATFA